MLIVIPFCEPMRQAAIAGNKTCTTRTKRYGKPGDHFGINAYENSRNLQVIFKLTSVQAHQLGYVATNFWKQEGFENIAGFITLWCKLHPSAHWQPLRQVYIHFFELVPELLQPGLF